MEWNRMGWLGTEQPDAMRNNGNRELKYRVVRNKGGFRPIISDDDDDGETSTNEQTNQIIKHDKRTHAFL